MPQKPHTIPSTPHRGSGVLPAMVSGGRCSVGAVTRHSGCAAPSAPPRLRVNPSTLLDASPSAKSAKSAKSADLPSSIQNSKFKIPHSLPSAPLTFPTLSTILYPHEHGQNPLDPRSCQHRTSQGSRHCGMFGVGPQGVSDSGLSSRSSSIAQSHHERSYSGLAGFHSRGQKRDHPVDVYPLDRANLRHRRAHQTPPVGLSPVAAVCDRRRPQGRDAAPSGSHSRGSAAPSAPPRLRVNPSAILDRITGWAGYTGT